MLQQIQNTLKKLCKQKTTYASNMKYIFSSIIYFHERILIISQGTKYNFAKQFVLFSFRRQPMKITK